MNKVSSVRTIKIMEDLQVTPEIPSIRKEVMIQYLDYLKQKYETLASEPFSTKARLAVKNEIESVNAYLERDRMEEVFVNLNGTFGIESKPNFDPPSYGKQSDFRIKASKGLEFECGDWDD